jgi:GH25 family lysozyme M1 (1,4-beta-N-acetylmuramidase)
MKHIQEANFYGGKPMNGIDVSHWNGVSSEPVPEWVRFYGMKAAHVGGSKMENGIDPLLNYNRKRAADAYVRWRAMYLFMVADVPQVEQINKLIEAVGTLHHSECVMIDWEDPDMTVLDEEAFYYLNAVYDGRWMMYVNDMTPAMTAWMTANKTLGSPIPVMHPNWSPEGWREADRWDAAVWQAGVGMVPGYADCIDVDLVTNHSAMDTVCGWASANMIF